MIKSDEKLLVASIHPKESKDFSFIYVTQCVPLVGSRVTIAPFVVNLPSLMYILLLSYPNLFSTSFYFYI